MMATMWIMFFPFSSGDALKDAMMAASRQRPDLCRPVAIGAGLLPGGTLQHSGRVELVDRQIALHAGHRRMLEPITRRRAHPRHLRQHRKMLGVVDPVELGLVFGGDIELHDKSVG